MTMTDPIADMLTRLRNANQAYHDRVTMPYSKIKANIAEVLKSEGYIAAWAVHEPDEGTVGKTLIVDLKYGTSRERSLAGIKRVSKPGLRVYAKAPDLPRVLGGLGVAIISTSQGLLTDRQARELHGLSRTLVANMIVGVTEGYKKTLEIAGTGYRVVAKGNDLEFALGFSHPVLVTPPTGITFRVERPTVFSVEGIDKQQVGEVAANIRKIRPPEPYKGKGVKYEGEVMRREAGKAGKKGPRH